MEKFIGIVIILFLIYMLHRNNEVYNIRIQYLNEMETYSEKKFNEFIYIKYHELPSYNDMFYFWRTGNLNKYKFDLDKLKKEFNNEVKLK